MLASEELHVGDGAFRQGTHPGFRIQSRRQQKGGISGPPKKSFKSKKMIKPVHKGSVDNNGGFDTKDKIFVF